MQLRNALIDSLPKHAFIYITDCVVCSSGEKKVN